MKEFYWIVEYIATFIEVLMSCYFCATFIRKDRLKESKKILYIYSSLAATIIIVFNHIEFFSSITSVVYVFLCILMQWIIYRKRYILSVGFVIVYAVVLSVIDILIIYFVGLIFDASVGYILIEQSMIRVACILLSKSILVVLVLTTNRLMAYKKTIPPLYIVIMGACSAFLIVSNFVLIHSEISNANDDISGFTMFFFVASLGIAMIIFGFVFKIADGYEQKNNNMLIEMNNKMLKKSLDETERTFELWRQSIHDYKNNIIALTQMIEEERLDDIKKYLHNENKLIEQKMFYIKTGNSIIDTIINMKQNIAQKYNITYVTNITLPPNIVIGDIDISTILGNLIDNAIEASKEEDEPYIEVNIKQQKSFFIINIKNKYSKENNIDELKTNKSNSEFHGIGLKSVRKTVNKYGGSINLEIKDQEFVASILIQNISE